MMWIEEFIRELVEPHKAKFTELIELVKKFDAELNNITNKGHIEVSIRLGDGREYVYNYIYYAIIYPDHVNIVADEFTDMEEQEGVSRRIQLARIYL